MSIIDEVILSSWHKSKKKKNDSVSMKSHAAISDENVKQIIRADHCNNNKHIYKIH